MLYGIRCEVDLGRKREVVVDLASLECSQVEVESFQVENDVVWNILETRSASLISNKKRRWKERSRLTV